MRAPLAALIIALLVLPGCMGDDTGPLPTHDPLANIVDGLLVSTHLAPGGTLEARAASGALSTITLDHAAAVEWPDNVFLFADKRFGTAKSIDATAGTPIQLLVPPGATTLSLKIAGETVDVPSPDTGHQLFSGENIIEWFKVQRDEYPNRCNGCPNYVRAQEYFAGLFEEFGMAEVSADPYGANNAHAEFANVVAYKYPLLDTDHPRFFGVGGHYDVVEQTTEGAFDDTSGTLATLELARVFAGIETNHNIFFGLWGGEEAGLQGSNFFVRSSPQVVYRMDAYVNLDVIGFSWPGPMPVSEDGEPDCAQMPVRSATATTFCPDPIVVTTGPDGPVADRLLASMLAIQQTYLVGSPDSYFIYEPVAEGQVGGYQPVNAQSDHTAFIAAGVPSYFFFNGNALRNPIGIHNPLDAIESWTKYTLYNFPADLEQELSDEERARSEGLMATGFEVYLWMTFYTFLLYDLGLDAPLPGPL